MKKILLLHGWNYKNYTKNVGKETNPWHNRDDFVISLSKKYDLINICFPGFCGEIEPKKPWEMQDYVDYVDKKIKETNPDYVLGYSFGAAVALNWKHRTRSEIKLILLSPAIIRDYKEKNKFSKLSVIKNIIPTNIIDWARDKYLTYKIKNPYYATGTKFLKQSYLNIVKIDSSALLKDLNSGDFCIIFGEKDTATPPRILQKKLNKNILDRIYVIKNGTHDIANTNTEELVEIVSRFVDKKEFSLKDKSWLIEKSGR